MLILAADVASPDHRTFRLAYRISVGVSARLADIKTQRLGENI